MNAPPKWARWLASIFVPGASKEFVLGDLEELFHEDAANVGRRRAIWIYLGRGAGMWSTYVLSGRPVENLVLDLRFALRGLRRNPTVTLVSAATIAVGIGAATAVLSIAHAVLFRPPPIAEPDRVVSVWELRTGDVWESVEGRLLRHDRFEAYRAGSSAFFSGMAAHSYTRVTIGTDEGATSVNGFVTSANYFTLLGLKPALGRLYSGDDEASVVLSQRIWRNRFGADPGVIGRTVSINSRPFTVVGVVGGGFLGTMSTFTGDVWVPWRAFTRLSGISDAAVRLVPLARLRPDVPRDIAEERLAELARAIPSPDDATVQGARLESVLWRSDLSKVLRLGATLLAATAALLLTIAAANVGGMLLARSHDRRREIAVRLAIGAGGGRLVRQLLTESCLLALIGGAGGVLLAYLGTSWLAHIQFPLDATLTVDLRPAPGVLLVSLAVTLMTGVLFGLGPALSSARTDLSTTLKEGARGLRLGGRRNNFVVAQLALCTVLLLMAGLLVRSLRAMAEVPLGFDPHHVTVATIELGAYDYERSAVSRFFDRLVDRTRALPGAESVGLARFVMLGGANASVHATAADGDPDVRISAATNVVDPSYFRTMKIELAEGRFFDEGDVDGSPPVAVVNETLAERLWPRRSAVGRTLRTGGNEREVVGVVRDGVYVFVYDGPRPYVFFPSSQNYLSGMTLHVRTREGAGPIGADIRRLVRDLNPDVAPSNMRTMEQVVHANNFGARFIAGLASLFAGVGLLLAALGVYGLLAVQVAQQAKELGVRMAMGADPRDVLLLVVRRGAGYAAVGCGLGVLIALGAGRWVGPLLYAVRPLDLATYALVPTVLMGTALVASVIPARRATQVDPTMLMRDG